jgi:predicted glycosyltransferase involved in capsule biosynthesis
MISTMQRQSPSFVFLGASADVGIFKNCFGDANSFFRSDTFRQFGGYTEDRNLGYEDWELYSRIVMDGYVMQVVPQGLYHYRFTAGSMQKSTSYSASRQRALRAYLERVDQQQSADIALK